MSKKQLTKPFDGAAVLPVRVGWYPCVLKEGIYEMRMTSQWPRRYWNGIYFSGPCHSDWSDEIEAAAKSVRAVFDNRKLQWCGLTAPYRK